MRRPLRLPRVPDGAQSALMALGVVGLATTGYLVDAVIDRWIAPTPVRLALTAVIVVQVVPALAIWLVDRAIARVAPSWLPRFHVGLFAAALIVLLHQPIDRLSAPLALAAFVAIVVLAARYRRLLRSLFVYTAPLALVLMVYAVLVLWTAVQTAPSFAEATGGEGLPAPVFVVIFDELSYDALFDEHHAIDPERYPNFARLASESVTFSNATASFFYTWQAVPELIEGLAPLAERAEFRLYLQYAGAEEPFMPECGLTYTCRGATYLADERPALVVKHIALTVFVEALPRIIREPLRLPLDWIARSLGATASPADPDAIHLYSTLLFERFIDDIDASMAGDRISVLHTHLSHFPFVFDRSGTLRESPHARFSDSANPDAVYANYLRQLEYADAWLGRLIAKLEQEGLYDEGVLVVTGDHGVRRRFPDDGRPEPFAVDRLMTNVPLFVRAPGLAPSVSDVGYSHVDFGATVLDTLGIEDSRDGPGVSAFSPTRPERERLFSIKLVGLEPVPYHYDEQASAWLPIGGPAEQAPAAGATER